MLGKFEEEIVGLELGRSVEVIDGATDGEIWGLPVGVPGMTGDNEGRGVGLTDGVFDGISVGMYVKNSDGL